MEYYSYNVYRGLQKPLILFGMKGQNIFWAAGTWLGALIMVGIGLSFFGFLIGLLMGISVMGFGAYRINKNIKKGLHNRKEYKGIWVITNLIKPTYGMGKR